jgi:inhibitor of cysteine peptidase
MLLAFCLISGLGLAGCIAPPGSSTQAPDERWQRYGADSGYEISYPLATYSMRNGLFSPSTVLYPGVKVLEPNDSFSYRTPRAENYQLSIAVHTNEQQLSLADAKQLLSRGSLIQYDPALLSDHPVISTTLGGVQAVRVDDLPVGPAGITTQIMAIHNTFVYEVLVEPHLLTTNQAEPYVAGAPSTENRALVEKMLATFKILDLDFPVTNSVPLTDTQSGGSLLGGTALVESVTVQSSDTPPVQIKLLVRGNLPDSCTNIGEIKQEYSDNSFQVQIATSRPSDVMCAAMLTPFEQVVSLNTAGLSAGTYSVIVNGIQTTFTLGANPDLPAATPTSTGG